MPRPVRFRRTSAQRCSCSTSDGRLCLSGFWALKSCQEGIFVPISWRSYACLSAKPGVALRAAGGLRGDAARPFQSAGPVRPACSAGSRVVPPVL